MLKASLMSLLIVISSASFAVTEFPSSAEQVRPLLLSSMVPDVTLKTVDGNDKTLKAQLAGKPAVLVFYRGGWCPYCNLQLSDLRLIKQDLDALGYQLIAISPDRPDQLKLSIGELALDYTLLSDSKADAAGAFGIGFKVDDATVERYKNNKIDLEKSSGEKHHVLPVPTVYVVDAEGKLQFSYINPDHRARIPSSVVLEAAKVIAQKSQYLKLKPQP